MYILLNILLVLSFIIFILWFVFIIQIKGDSMYPTLRNGSIEVGYRVLNKSKLKVGEVYVFKPPYSKSGYEYVIKRLIDKEEDLCFFVGDNKDVSYDSREYGYVSSRNVIAHLPNLKEGKVYEK